MAASKPGDRYSFAVQADGSFENFVAVQSDAALRQVIAYDNNVVSDNEIAPAR